MDSIDHVAIPVRNVAETVDWYRHTFRCEIEYQDDTWASLKFGNIKLALVVEHQHPPHIAFASPDAARFGELKQHRDGTKSVYVKDPAGNPIEIMAVTD
jgi:catechol 2,3-dioxygenase-like lactoylglutathione lyase family enzyme